MLGKLLNPFQPEK